MSHTIKQYRKSRPMWMYEKNFMLIKRLCPELDITDELECVHTDANIEYRLKIRVLERCPYTSTLIFEQNLQLPDTYAPKLEMKIRLYYDARVAEVLTYQGFSCLLERYGSAKKQGMKKNEKRQTNILLHDWLTIFLSHQHKLKVEYA